MTQTTPSPSSNVITIADEQIRPDLDRADAAAKASALASPAGERSGKTPRFRGRVHPRFSMFAMARMVRDY